eukprot:3780218-Rhodomonas_salina.2
MGHQTRLFYTSVFGAVLTSAGLLLSSDSGVASAAFGSCPDPMCSESCTVDIVSTNGYKSDHPLIPSPATPAPSGSALQQLASLHHLRWQLQPGPRHCFAGDQARLADS